MTTRREVLALGWPLLLAGCGGGGGGGDPAPIFDPPGPISSDPPVWRGFAGNAQHQALSAIASQPLQRILWSTPVDLNPPYRAGGSLLIHYGSPVITASNTVLVPVKTGLAGGFRVEARAGATGSLRWQQASSYVLPASSWTPSFNIALTRNNRLVMPESGGRLWLREEADRTVGTARHVAFYGDAIYAANAAALDASVLINTPVTVDDVGNAFFGFLAAPGNPAGLRSGFARVAPDGSAVWIAAADRSGDAAITQPAMNAAPALSLDQRTLYVAVNTPPVSGQIQTGALLALDAATLALVGRQALREPRSGQPARVSDSATASPMVGPDGDVYYGVLDATRDAHNGRGWLLHFDATLAQGRLPGSFGWDDTPSLVPASMVPAYAGGSPYLLLVKYNNYFGAGSGDGVNQMAIVDPRVAQNDRFVPAGAVVPVMKEVLLITGPTPDPNTPGGVREWCVNTAVVDPQTGSVLVNNEDGIAYRWDLQRNQLTEGVRMNAGVGQAYTPSLIGPGGVVFSINNAQLHAIGR
jgi:hypothetical protein